MLVRKTIFGGILTFDGNIVIDGLYGIITGGNSQIGGTLQVIGAQRNFSTLQVDDVLNLDAQFDVDIGASTEFDINDGLFRFSDGTNTLRVDDSNGIQLLGNSGVGSSADVLYKLWVEPDEDQIGIGSQNDQTYAILEDGWGVTPKAAVRITRDVSKYGLSDYAGILLQAKPTAPHTAQGMYGVYSATPANHHSGLFMATYSGKWMTIFKGSMFGDFHLQTEYDRDVALNFSQMATNGFPAVALIRGVIGFDHSSDSFKLEYGTAFTATPAIEIFSDNTARIISTEHSEFVTESAPANVTVQTDLTEIFSVLLLDLESTAGASFTHTHNVDLDGIETAAVKQVINVYAKLYSPTAGKITYRLRSGSNVNIDSIAYTGGAAEYWAHTLYFDGTIWRILDKYQSVAPIT